MKIKFAGKWYKVAMVQYNFGKPYYEIYDEPDTDPEHTDWITHPEEVVDDESENSSFYTVSNIETKQTIEKFPKIKGWIARDLCGEDFYPIEDCLDGNTMFPELNYPELYD